jgi:DNA-binding MarR family transcriptional regulator
VQSSHPTDGRSRLIHVSEAGRQFHTSAIERIRPFLLKISEIKEFQVLLSALPSMSIVRRVLEENKGLRMTA